MATKFIDSNGVKHLWGKVLDKTGKLGELNTTDKSSLVDAINEVRQAVEVGGTGSVVTVDTTNTTNGAAKTYTFKQGDTEIGKIDIPKDLVVSNGEIVVDPKGQTAGTYLKLTLANDGDPIYINVADLVDVYTAKTQADKVQLAISDTNEISATIVAGSITGEDIADGAVTRDKIGYGAIMMRHLTDGCVGDVDIADNAVGGGHIQSGAVDEAHLSFKVKNHLNRAVTEVKINGVKVDATAYGTSVEEGEYTGQSVNIPIDTYTALSTGEIDAAIAEAEAAYTTA